MDGNSNHFGVQTAEEGSNSSVVQLGGNGLTPDRFSLLVRFCDRPFAFFGHSMGALVSFELARYLRETDNFCPSYLFVSGRHAPQLPDSKPPIHALPEAEFLERLRDLNGTPRAVMENTELMQLLLPALRADFQILETYTYPNKPPLPCAIAAFGCLQDPEASREELVAWAEQTRASFSLQMFPGDHFFLHDCQGLLLQLISEYLESISL
jgi:medium-chain acyl-[acyl-carrier-protein] hydrolase